MTKTVIEMARSVGATAYTNRHYQDRPTHTFTVDQLEAFAALVAEAKRMFDEGVVIVGHMREQIAEETKRADALAETVAVMRV